MHLHVYFLYACILGYASSHIAPLWHSHRLLHWPVSVRFTSAFTPVRVTHKAQSARERAQGHREAIFLRQSLSFPISSLARSKQGLGPETHSWGWWRRTSWALLTYCCGKDQPEGTCAFRGNGGLSVLRCIHTDRDFISGDCQWTILLVW